MFPLSFVIALALVLYAHVTHALLVRDVDGNWKPLTWGKRSTGPGGLLRLSLTNHNDKVYSIPVGMGTPLQEIPMAISLSQNFIAVATSNSPGDASFYNVSQSGTASLRGVAAGLSGSSGSMTTASFIGESCQILDFDYVASLTPASANVDKDLYPDGTHGVLGYGLDIPPSTPNDSALLISYIPKGIKSATAVCGIELNWAGDSDGGLFTMGGVDQTAYVGDFTKIFVPPATSVQRPSWSVPVDEIFTTLRGGVLSIAGSLGSVDPYYPRIGLPADAAKALYSKIKSAAPYPANTNRYTVPCDANFTITMTFGGKNFTMDPRDTISKEGSVCFGIVEIVKSNLYQIGSPFLRNVYTAFGADFDANGNPTPFVKFASKVIRPALRRQ